MTAARTRIPTWLPPTAGVGMILAGLSAGTVRADEPVVSLPGLGSPWIAETGPTPSLQTHLVLLTQEGRPRVDRLEFELGFSTTEVVSLGALFDSLTLSLARADGSDPVIVATADVFGLTLAPEGVSGLVPGSSVRLAEVGFRVDELPGALTTFAYAIEVELPVGALTQSYRATFDLFSNGDPQMSRGYVLAVPEPALTRLLGSGFVLLGGVSWLSARRKTSRSPVLEQTLRRPA